MYLVEFPRDPAHQILAVAIRHQDLPVEPEREAGERSDLADVLDRVRILIQAVESVGLADQLVEDVIAAISI